MFYKYWTVGCSWLTSAHTRCRSDGGQIVGAGNSNFRFLLADWPDLAQHARRAEKFARIDPRASMFYSRYTVERLYKVETALVLLCKDDLNAQRTGL